ncbi:TPA: type II toxin-antitoxin system HicB family antitoxin [Streptococcus agalactiae]|nr:type II toxin-antitoxin system HicB family antitoxin [Streptococcus agalactiae]
MLISYPAIFHKEEEGYWVEFLEFGGGTQGKSLEDSITNAQEMLEGIIMSYADSDMTLPKPSQLNPSKVTNGILQVISVNL